MRVLAIIPARAGSKRVRKKNFRPFADSTLTDLAIQQALGANLITDIVVSSDSKQVLAIAKNYQGVIPMQRPEKYARDESPAIEYVKHALTALKDAGKQEYDLLVILQPSSPLRSAHDIEATINLLMSNPTADSAVSVVKIDHMVHPIKLKTMDGCTLHPFIEAENGRFSDQELPDVYVRNCAVYCTHTTDLMERNDVIGETSLGYLMPPETSVDINTMMDFEFAEYLYLKNNK